VFYTHVYNHARRLRLKKLSCLELSLEVTTEFFEPLLDPGGGFASKTAAGRFQKRNGLFVTTSKVMRLQIYNGYYTLCNGHSPTDKSVRSGVTIKACM
jgi:hypothetical protein